MIRKSRSTSVAGSLTEAFWLSLCAGVLAWKLLLPGFIGMADNGDFGRVAGPLCLASVAVTREDFFQPVYLRGKANCFHTHVPASELALAGLASAVEQTFGSRTFFDIRWLGAIHALIFLALYYSILLLLRPLGGLLRFSLSLLALWIFADIGLIAYFNSFYSDTAAALGVLVATFVGVHLLAAGRIAPVMLLSFAAAAALAASSKPQHAIIGPIAALLAFWIASRAVERATRWTACTVGVALTLVSGWTILNTPPAYEALSRFDVVFSKITTQSHTPANDLVELGLDPAEARYIGMSAYTAKGPIENAAWAERFVARCNAGRVLRFYLAHPARTLAILRSDLEQEAWQRRDPQQSNFTRESGWPEGNLTNSLGSWSAFRTWAFHKWPALIVIWLVLSPAIVHLIAARDHALQRALKRAMPAISFLALTEFAIASLADSSETPRHLLLFHVVSDISIFLGLLFAASFLKPAGPRWLRRMASAATVVCLACLLAIIGRYEAAAAVNPHPSADVPAGAVDDASPSIAYSGAWRKTTFGSAFRGTLTYSDELGASARFTFTGAELVYFYTKAPNRGMALVTIDGSPRGTVDLFDPQIVWRAHTAFGGLKAGSHSIEIRVLGRHRADSSGNVVDIDALLSRY
jgi:hypothetical protein